MKSKALALTLFTAFALQAPLYACDKGQTKKEVSREERKELQKKRLTKKMNQIKRRLEALETSKT